MGRIVVAVFSQHFLLARAIRSAQSVGTATGPAALCGIRTTPIVHIQPDFRSFFMGRPYRADPVVGAVGEMASMKRLKSWKTGEGGLCRSSSAIQTRLDPSSLLEERSKTPIVFVVLLCCRLPPILGERAKVYR